MKEAHIQSFCVFQWPVPRHDLDRPAVLLIRPLSHGAVVALEYETTSQDSLPLTWASTGAHGRRALSDPVMQALDVLVSHALCASSDSVRKRVRGVNHFSPSDRSPSHPSTLSFVTD